MVSVISPWLKPEGSVVRTGFANRFVVAKHFTSSRFDLGKSFARRFLGKVEDATKLVTLSCQTLLQGLAAEQLIAELGGEQRAESLTADIFWLTERQPQGEPGLLLTDGRANIFYVRDVNGELCQVRIYWQAGPWQWQCGVPRDYPGQRQAGPRVFSVA